MRWLLKRWWIWAGAAATAFVAAAFLTAYLWVVPVSVSRITQANCDKIRLGWKPAEVLALLGDCDNKGLPFDEQTEVWNWWDNEGNTIVVTFDGKEGVTDKQFTPSPLSFYVRTALRIERCLGHVGP